MLLWLPCVIGQAIIFLPCGFCLLLSFFFLFFPRLISATADWMSTIHTWCGPSANLECSLKCAACGSLEIQDAKKSPFWHHHTILSSISSELRHLSTVGKNLLNSNTSSACPDNMVNFGLLTAEIHWQVWGTPANFNGFRVLAALLHGTLVEGVSQTLRR